MRSLTIAGLACIGSLCTATIIKEVSFQDLIASSNQIVSGHVTKSWTSWGSQHKFIWTRYEIAVEDVLRGPNVSSVVVSEPGGVLDGKAMSVESAVIYTVGEHVALFLHHFPSGENRTVGWAQGKFTIDEQQRVRSAIPSLDGITYAELRRRVGPERIGTAAK